MSSVSSLVVSHPSVKQAYISSNHIKKARHWAEVFHLSAPASMSSSHSFNQTYYEEIKMNETEFNDNLDSFFNYLAESQRNLIIFAQMCSKLISVKFLLHTFLLSGRLLTVTQDHKPGNGSLDHNPCIWSSVLKGLSTTAIYWKFDIIFSRQIETRNKRHQPAFWLFRHARIYTK